VLHGFVHGRIEGQPDGRDALDPELAERVQELTGHHRDALGEGLDVGRLGRVAGGAFQVVEHGEELAQHVLPRDLGHVGQLSPRALLEIVEVGGEPQ
jgi:hypothetical protein